MAEYIPKEAALKVVEKYGTTNGFALGSSFALGRHTGLAICIASEIAEIPAADVAPVVHGRWRYFHKQNIAVCTECSFERDLDTNFGRAVNCPNCGAKMDGVDDG